MRRCGERSSCGNAAAAGRICSARNASTARASECQSFSRQASNDGVSVLQEFAELRLDVGIPKTVQSADGGNARGNGFVARRFEQCRPAFRAAADQLALCPPAVAEILGRE